MMKAFAALLVACCFANSLAQYSQSFNNGNGGFGQGEAEYRPCPKSDVNCIRKYFAEHSHCSPVEGYGDEYHKKIQKRQTVYYATIINSTVTLEYPLYNLNAKVDDFYIDRGNDKVVLVVAFNNLRIKSEHVNIRFHRRGKEPVITKGTFYAEHGPIIVTATILSVNNIKLKDSVSFAFLTEPLPRVFDLSPSLFRSRDPEVKLASVEFIKRIRPINLEFFVIDAPFLFATFVQDVICDFGLKVL